MKAYQFQDQLRRATKKLAGVILGSEDYFYAEGGQRIAIVKRDGSGAKTELVWFIGDTQAHYDTTGTIDHVYSYVSLGMPVVRVDRTTDVDASIEFQFHGLANSTIGALDYDGTNKASFIYAPFGEVVHASDDTSGAGLASQRRRHNDKFSDRLTSLSYYGARYYDTATITWTQLDPTYLPSPDAEILEPRRANLYTYTLNNSLRYLDPDGRDPKARRPLPKSNAIEPVLNPLVPYDFVAAGVLDLTKKGTLQKLRRPNPENPSAQTSDVDALGVGGSASLGGPNLRINLLPKERRLTAKERRAQEAAAKDQRDYDRKLGRIPKQQLPNRKKADNRRQVKDADANDLTDKKQSIEASHPENSTSKTDQRLQENLKDIAPKKHE